MATPAVIVVVTVALATLVALGLTVVYLLQHLKRLTVTLRGMQEQLDPTLRQLSRDAEVTSAELARVAEAAEQLGEGRRHRAANE